MKKGKISIFKSICSKKTLRSLRLLPKVLSKFEKTVLIVLGVIIIASGAFVWRNHWLKTTHEVPAYGGTYTEGVVGEAKDLDKHLARLTGAGLTVLAPNGDVKGDLAESWEIQEDGKLYQFKLRAGYNSSDLASQIAAKNIWSGIEVGTPAENLITFRFKQPFSPFLYASTEPIFSYGPYQILKEEKTQITLEANSAYWKGQPHIEKIIIKLYPNQDELIKAARHGDFTAYLTEGKDDYKPANFVSYDAALPRELDLFFNLGRDDLKNVDLRRNLRDYKPLDKNYTWTLVTSDNPKNVTLAGEIKNRWQNLHVTLNIQTYDNITLQKDIIPKRSYDLLLYGLDYGPDPDPYPFWHSSQIGATGENLSNFSSKTADRLLEDARQTFDFKVRNQKYADFKKILDDQVPFITIEKGVLHYNISSDVKGIGKIYGSSEADRFLNVSDWYIKSKRVKN
jgi:ABC-type transport system substrate-binding protein